MKEQKNNRRKKYFHKRKKNYIEEKKSTGLFTWFKNIITGFFKSKKTSKKSEILKQTNLKNQKKNQPKKIDPEVQKEKNKAQKIRKKQNLEEKKQAREEQLNLALQRIEEAPNAVDLRPNHKKKQEKNVKKDEFPDHERVIGKADFTRNGAAYIIVENRTKDIFVPKQDTQTALPGDTVEVVLLDNDRGKIVKILERNVKKWACVLELSEQFAFAVPNDTKMPYHIFVPLENTMGAKDKDRVMVEITDFLPRAKNPQGKVVQIFGVTGEHHTEMNSIIQEFNLPEEFPQEVVKAAEEFSSILDSAEIAKRRDFRSILTFTIDPSDAKDFDDALSFQILDNGNYEIGIHIADVSHYVLPNSTLDQEAYLRGNSVYLVDRVIPMLPEKLSNELCSLRPEEEKYCFSAVFEFEPSGKKIKQWLGRTVIFSQKRYTYEQAQQLIEEKDVDPVFSPAILTLHHVAQQLRKERMEGGALEISSREIKFILDEEHKPTSVYEKVSKAANFLIEEFMLLANKTVAEVLSKVKRPLVYRVHDLPRAEKIQEFRLFVSRFGYKIGTNPTQIKKELNQLIEQISGKPEESIISTMLIRTMAKAVYTTENIGHYGLNFKHYAHFTSPIRRYADLLVHRCLQAFLEKKNYLNVEELEKMAQHISSTEKQASDAERESTKFKQVEWMERHIGEEFEGLISGLTDWGIYVETIDHHCEGMINLRTMSDDQYVFDQKTFAVIGKKTQQKLFFGDQVRIKVVGVNMLKRTIDFEWISKM